MTKPLSVRLGRGVRLHVDRDLFHDMLCDAAEGGSNYWASFRSLPGESRTDYRRLRLREHERHAADALPVDRIVSAATMLRGFHRLALATFPARDAHMTNILTGNTDAETADVVLQMALFGDVIYG